MKFEIFLVGKSKIILEISEILFQIYVMLRRLKSFLDCFDESNLFSDFFFVSALESNLKSKFQSC